ncbi:hypothetical protein KCU67_g3011, partial [Aureobasidium melanogenum]
MDQESGRAVARGHARTKSNTSVGSNNPTRPRHTRSKSTKKLDSIYSDEATVAFIKRTLCPHQLTGPEGSRARNISQPLSELLPPLTTSHQVDLQLYALISIIIKDFVQAWYSRITPDHEFTDQVVHIIAHCTRAIEQRITAVDLEDLIFDELPELIDAHVTAYRTAYSGSYSSLLVADPREIYHAINPHPALSPVPFEPGSLASSDQAENEAAWRQLLIQGVLSHLLPPEDLNNPPLRVLVTEIFSELIIGRGVCGNICEGWFIWDVVSKLLAITRPPESEVQQEAPPSPTRLEKFGLLADDSDDVEEPPAVTTTSPVDTLSGMFLQVMQYAFLAFISIRAFFTALSDAATLPPRTNSRADATHAELDDNGSLWQQSTHDSTKRPILGMSLWSCCSHLLSLDLQMPWLTTMGSYIQWLLICSSWKVGYTNSRLDRLLSHHIRTKILDPARLPTILLLIRTNMFPNNSLGPGRVPPTPEEALELRAKCAASIIAALPPIVVKQLFANSKNEDVHKQVQDMLDVFGDAYLNKHLIVAIVDLVVVRLFPELESSGITAVLKRDESREEVRV